MEPKPPTDHMVERERRADILIAETVPEDIPSLSRVLQKGWLSAYPNPEIGLTYEHLSAHTEQFLDSEKQEWQRRNLSNPDARKWTARVDDEIVGFADVDLVTNRVLGLYVIPEQHGSGIGKQLMETAMGALDEARPMYVNVASYNQRAIRFYEKYGFRFLREGDPYDVSGVPMPTQEMIRDKKEPGNSE